MSTQTILFLSANPRDTTKLRLDQELRDIGEGLRRAQHRDQFQLEQRMAVRPQDIQRAMLDLNPQIVHFSGHGDGDEGLVFEDELGNSQRVSGDAIASLFELFSDQLSCVVLNGCYTEVQAKAIAEHIPHVIGMNKAIGDKAAIAFAVGFYDALGAGRDVEFAFKLGCSAIRMEGIEEHLTPILLKKSQNESPPSLQPSAPKEPMTDSHSPIEVFISYSHKDEELKDALITHLALLKRQNKITDWQDRAIEGGEEWAAQIKEKLHSASIILLLISPDFMASDYCYDIEMKEAIARHDAGTARVIPIILRPCDWKDARFSKLQALPKNSEPVTKWSDRDEAFLNVVKGLRRAIESQGRVSKQNPLEIIQPETTVRPGFTGSPVLESMKLAYGIRFYISNCRNSDRFLTGAREKEGQYVFSRNPNKERRELEKSYQWIFCKSLESLGSGPIHYGDIVYLRNNRNINRWLTGAREEEGKSVFSRDPNKERRELEESYQWTFYQSIGSRGSGPVSYGDEICLRNNRNINRWLTGAREEKGQYVFSRDPYQERRELDKAYKWVLIQDLI